MSAINNIQNNYNNQVSNPFAEQQKKNKDVLTDNFDAKNAEKTQAVDKIVLSNKNKEFTIDTGIYDKKGIEWGSEVDSIRALEQDRMEKFNEFVQKMLQNQNTDKAISGAGPKVSVYLPIVGEDGKQSIKLVDLNPTDEDIQKAKASIAEGGEYSIEKVADRILGMAQALSYGDDSKIGMLRKAVEDGFNSVMKLYGKNTPQITKDTYNEVMKRFDDWQTDADKRATNNATVNNAVAQGAVNAVAAAV